MISNHHKAYLYAARSIRQPAVCVGSAYRAFVPFHKGRSGNKKLFVPGRTRILVKLSRKIRHRPLRLTSIFHRSSRSLALRAGSFHPRAWACPAVIEQCNGGRHSSGVRCAGCAAPPPGSAGPKPAARSRGHPTRRGPARCRAGRRGRRRSSVRICSQSRTAGWRSMPTSQAPRPDTLAEYRTRSSTGQPWRPRRGASPCCA